MRIALDGTPLSVPTGGIRRYTLQLAAALASEYPDDPVWLLSDQQPAEGFLAPAGVRLAPAAGSFLRRRWWLIGLPVMLSRIQAGIFHGTDFSVPYLPFRPAVMTVHDLSPWKPERWRAPSTRVRRRTPWLLGLSLATMVITPSETVRREVLDWFALHPSRVVSVPLAAAECFRPTAATASPKPYFLLVGTLEPRKNLELAVEAWRALRATHDVDLVLAGRIRSDAPPLPDCPGLRYAGVVSDSQLAELYSGAAAVLAPSWYEGFGLPVLEAMQCGAPVLAAGAGALRETAGDAAVLLDPHDPGPWVEAMRAVLDNSGYREALSEKSLRRASFFSWARTARSTHDVYMEAIRRFC